MADAQQTRRRIMTLILLAIAVFPPSPIAQSRTGVEDVPFVGCKSDGQAGPLEAPNGKSKTIAISAHLAQRLAYYKAEQGPGVLAPKGWYCFEIYGSNGGTLYVAPEPIDPNNLFSSTWGGFMGPVVEMAAEEGGTSGRFGVTKTIARVFPAHRDFVRRVIKQTFEPASDFPYGPYPNDKLIYKSKEIVEFQTPANTEGLGTTSRIKKGSRPITGVAILLGPESELSLLRLSVRLSPDMSDLTRVIIQQVERDAPLPRL